MCRELGEHLSLVVRVTTMLTRGRMSRAASMVVMSLALSDLN